MTTLDKIMLGLTLLGLGLNIVLALLPTEWRDTHKTAVIVGHMAGLVLMGVGLYMLALSAMPAEWGSLMWPKASMVIGAVLLVGGAIWQMTEVGKAKTTGNQVTGASISGNGQAGAAANVSATGAPGENVVGAEINATGCPGDNVTGLHVTQTGPGTGLRVTATSNGGGGSITGMRVTATAKPCDK